MAITLVYFPLRFVIVALVGAITGAYGYASDFTRGYFGQLIMAWHEENTL